MTVDTKALRKSHVEGWRPRQSVEIDVLTLKALLDELDELRARRAESDHLDRLAAELDELVVCIGCGTPVDDGKICESCAELVNVCEECGAPGATVMTDDAWFCRACAVHLPDAEEVEP